MIDFNATPEEIAEIRANLRRAHAQMQRDLARSIINWDWLDELHATSGLSHGQALAQVVHGQDEFLRLIDMVIAELQSYKEFPFKCVNAQAL